jgi:pimeloyl-ACP methyl ester carboxylesterase
MASSQAPNAWLDKYYAAPHTLVKIGRRRRLNLLVAGEGGPTVIFATGLIGTTLGWARVQPAVAHTTRTVAFDKAGMGFSDPGPMPRTASAIVGDLRAALAAAAIAPPYILVGHSAGGPQMRLFAFRHPQEVVGMVMVDSSSEFQDRRLDAAMGSRQTERQRGRLLRDYTRLTRLARAGALTSGTPDYARAVGVGGLSATHLTPAVWAASVAQHTSPAYWRAVRSESSASGGISSAEVAAARRSLGDIPLIVLTAGRNAALRQGETAVAAAARHAAWREMHDEIATLSTRGERRTIDAGHGMQMERPDVVIAAIEAVVAKVRDG